jgi:hypothetical protein
VLSFVGGDLYEELIPHQNELYHVSNKIKKPEKGGQGLAWAVTLEMMIIFRVNCVLINVPCYKY